MSRSMNLRGVVAMAIVGCFLPGPVFAQQGSSATERPQRLEDAVPAERLMVLTGIHRRKSRRMTRALRLEHGVMPTVVGAVRMEEIDADVFFVAYELSVFSRCLHRLSETVEGRQERREQCRTERGVETLVSKVRVAATPPRHREDIGGEIEVLQTVELGRRGRLEFTRMTHFHGIGLVGERGEGSLRVWISSIVSEVSLAETRGMPDEEEDLREGHEVVRLNLYSENLEPRETSEELEGEYQDFVRWRDYRGGETDAEVSESPGPILELSVGDEQCVLAFDAERRSYE